MKNFLFAVCFLTAYSGVAQKTGVESIKIPVPVQFAFDGMYPGTKGNIWIIDKKDRYRTTFELSPGKEVRIWITSSGEIPKLLEDIDKKEVPAIVRELSDKRITASMKVNKYSRLTTKKYGLFKVRTKVIYRQSLSNENHSWVNRYSEEGKFLGKEKRRNVRIAF
jgi:hypothetical protein